MSKVSSDKGMVCTKGADTLAAYSRCLRGPVKDEISKLALGQGTTKPNEAWVYHAGVVGGWTLDPESHPSDGNELEGGTETRALTVASAFSAADMCYINMSRHDERRSEGTPTGRRGTEHSAGHQGCPAVALCTVPSSMVQPGTAV